jgi:hypothetical protein
MSNEASEPGLDLGANLKTTTPKKFRASTGAKKAAGARSGDQEGKWIVLDDNDDIPPTGLYIGHNGVGYILKSGEPVFAYDYLLEILDHAVMSAPEINPNTRQVVGYRDRLRYSYRVVPAPTEEE